MGRSPQRTGEKRSRGERLASVLALVCFMLCRSGPVAAASEHRVALQYEMPPGIGDCPTRAAFQSSVAEQLGYSPFADDAEQRVIARATATNSGLRGLVIWRDATGNAQGERELLAKDGSCRELARSMAFAIVVQLQLLEATTREEESAPPEVPPVAPQETPLASADLNTQDPEAFDQPDEVDLSPVGPGGRRWQFDAGLGAAVAAGFAPGSSLLGRAFVTTRYGGASLELGGSGSWAGTHTANDGGFRSNVVLVSLAPCLSHGRLGGCLVGQVGQLRITGTDLDTPKTPSGLLSQVGLRLGASEPLGPLIASLHLDGLYTLTEWTVRVNDQDAWTTPSTTFSFGLDLIVPFAGQR